MAVLASDNIFKFNIQAISMTLNTLCSSHSVAVCAF